jgi:RNA polymerase sigma-70 factor (ECF subfamily)
MPPQSHDSRPRLRLVRGDANAGAQPRADRSDVAGRTAAPSPALDDSELLASLRAGDRSAATALHDRARPVIDRTIRRLLGPGDRDQEDLAQQAMIELVFTIDRYRGDCSLDSWISTLSAHVVYKQIRRRTIERRLFDGVEIETLQAASSDNVGREALMKNLVERVLNHLREIDESKAWAYVLHDVCGYDLREIAQITQVSVAAAQTRLVRGRRELEERIATDQELSRGLEDAGAIAQTTRGSDGANKGGAS